MGIYNLDGTIAVTIVDGTELTGVQAPDGSINIVLDDITHTGLYHPCGAFRVNSSYGDTVYDPSGAYYINNILGTTGLSWNPGIGMPTPPSGLKWDFVTFGNDRVVFNGQPVVALAA